MGTNHHLILGVDLFANADGGDSEACHNYTSKLWKKLDGIEK